MHFSYDERTEQLQELTRRFLGEHVLPAEPLFDQQAAGLMRSDQPWDTPPVIYDLQKTARSWGLWNLFLPDPDVGGGLSNVQYAPIAELSGRSPLLAPRAMNCSAPDSGNIELLHMFASAEQRKQWLDPLLDGTIRSAFCMTEPDVASSDANNVATRIVPDGDHYVVNGRKWWSSGALSPECRVFIVMGKTDPSAPRHRQQSIILVPRDTPGVEIVGSQSVFGYPHGPEGGHAEIVFRDVRVPRSNLLGEEGGGFAMSQARLGPGRIHHCMRLIGMAERAYELMCARAGQRSAFGSLLIEKDTVKDWIAEARIRIEQTRLLVLKTAWMIDTIGAQKARAEIHAIKVATPRMAQWVIDRAIQVHGGGGLSQYFPLAQLWSQARMIGFTDGPDEVHKNALARLEVRRLRDAGIVELKA